MTDLIHISFGDAALCALLGYIVVFFGLVLLMWVVMIMGKIMVGHANKAKTETPVPAAPAPAPVISEAPALPVSSSFMTPIPRTLPW